MRLFLIAIGIFYTACSIAHADAPKMRPATEIQILKHLSRSSEFKKARNGYQYLSGNPNGFKISHGEICVLPPGKRVDCVTVRTNGTDFEMIDDKGERTRF